MVRKGGDGVMGNRNKLTQAEREIIREHIDAAMRYGFFIRMGMMVVQPIQGKLLVRTSLIVLGIALYYDWSPWLFFLPLLVLVVFWAFAIIDIWLVSYYQRPVHDALLRQGINITWDDFITEVTYSLQGLTVEETKEEEK
jgi:hypothetical protein